MPKKTHENRTIAVLAVLCILLLTASLFLMVKTEKMQCELAALSVLPSQMYITAGATTTAVSESTAPSIQQIQNTETVTEKQTAVKQVNTATTTAAPTTEKYTEISAILVVNTNTKKIHSPDCAYAQNMKPENRTEIQSAELSAYEANGYSLCGHCKGCAK